MSTAVLEPYASDFPSQDHSPVSEVSVKPGTAHIGAALYVLPRLDTVPILIRGLSSDDHWTREGSAHALAGLADPRALSALEMAQSDPDEDVHSEARKAYKKTVAARNKR